MRQAQHHVISPGSQPETHLSLDEIQRWRMRWFLLIVIAFGLLASIGASIAIMPITRTPFSLVLPSSLVLTMRPVIRWLFPVEKTTPSIDR